MQTRSTTRRQDGARGAVLVLVLAASFSAFWLSLGLLLGYLNLRSLEYSPRQLFKVLACLFSFAVFGFHAVFSVVMVKPSNLKAMQIRRPPHNLNDIRSF